MADMGLFSLKFAEGTNPRPGQPGIPPPGTPLPYHAGNQAHNNIMLTKDGKPMQIVPKNS